jgi:hypothetical protein
MTEELEETIAESSGATNKRCRSCGSYVTSAFARVFGNNKDQVYACLECSTMRALRTGSGVVNE